MKKTTRPNWPQDYLSWTGSIRELADTATHILQALDPTVKAPNERLLRYYQQEGVLGRGRREGNRAVFSFEDLERVVAAKGLVKNSWTLSNAASLMDSQVAPVSGLLYGSPSPCRHPPHLASGSASPAPAPAAVPSESSSAQDVVARLMAKSGSFSVASSPRTQQFNVNKGLLRGAVSAPPLPGSMSGGQSPSLSPPASLASLTQSPVQALQPAPWMTVYLDEAAARRASPVDRQAAIDALTAVLRSLS